MKCIHLSSKSEQQLKKKNTKGTKCRAKQIPIIFRSFYLHFDHKKRATWKLCISTPFPFLAMEKMWVNPHFPAQESAELPVQSKWKAQAHNNTHAGRELRGRLHSKLLQQLNLNIKLIPLRGLITALIAAQMITEWDITPVISIYYRIDIRYYCICHYLYQSMPVNEDEWEAGDKKSSWAQVTPTALWGNCVCVYIWEALLRNSAWCWLTSWSVPVPMVPTLQASPTGWAASGASSPLTDPELGRVICGPRGNKRSLPKRGLCWAAHTSRLQLVSQNPIWLGRLFKPNCADCRGQSVRKRRHAVC